MLEFTKENRNMIGIIMAIIYTLTFNWIDNGRFPLIDTLAYSLPFLAFSALFGFGISKFRKDNNFGIYFAVISLLLVVSKI
ncbi:hypothetical protein [Olleya sp.]|jgi:ABC-type transport system involved in cytochrome c biogenesis permease subunit|uniref:hypothetical protein n=1 Tax=Olleya sp. TaxID=1906788 RepID=UPI0032D92C6D